MLVVETLAAPAPPSRRRRRPRPAEEAPRTPEVPLTRATAIRAGVPFADDEEGESWLAEATGTDEELDGIIEASMALLNRALFAHAAAASHPRFRELSALDALAVRIGFGSGDQVAAGRYTAAREVDVRAAGASRRRQRSEELRPQERVASVLGGRETIDACEALLLRSRADLDAERPREAALQLRAALDALLVELRNAISDPGHAEDMGTLESRRMEIERIATVAMKGGIADDELELVSDTVEVCERVIRRRRVLRGG